MNGTPENASQPNKKGNLFGKVINILFVIGLIIGGYYAYLYISENFLNNEDVAKTSQETTNGTTGETVVNEDSSENLDDTTEVEVIEITKEPLERINFQKVGTVSPYKSVTIMSETAGNILNFTKSEGDKVTEGTQIAEISDSAQTKIAQINYDNAAINLQYAIKSLETTGDSISQDVYSALIGAQTALLNYQNAINSYNNLASTLEEQSRSTKIGIQAAENSLNAAQGTYYNSETTNDVALENTLDQSLGGIVSALTLVDNAIASVDDIYGIRGNSNDDLVEILDNYVSYSRLQNLEDDAEDIFDKYLDLYDEYEDTRGTNHANDIQDLIYDTTELLEDTQSMLYETKSLLDDVLDEDATFVTIKTTINTLLPSIDQSKSALRQSSQGIDNALINNQIQPEGAFNGLEAAETQLISAKQALNQLEAANKAQLDSARNGIDLAAKQLESANAQVESMRAKGELQTLGAANQVELLEGQLDIMQANLDTTKIIAPIDGVILEKFIDEGNYVNPSQKIITVADMSKVKIIASLTAEELAFIKLGQTVTIEAPGGIKQSGRITKVLPSVDPVSKKIQVEIVIPNDNESFVSGMFTNVFFVDAQKESPTISVPFKSITFERSNAYIYVVENGKAIKKAVELGQISENMIEITNGITQGDKVITKGAKLVQDGELVKIVSS
jgi:RND family efflux transporter MFP subunit